MEHMDAIRPELIVFEATGGYESRAVKALSEAGYAVAVVNPTRVRRFAEAMGILAKTDKIDAQVIAHFASVVRPPANGRQTPLEEQLAAFVERRRQLLVELVAEKNRLSTCPDVCGKGSKSTSSGSKSRSTIWKQDPGLHLPETGMAGTGRDYRQCSRGGSGHRRDACG